MGRKGDAQEGAGAGKARLDGADGEMEVARDLVDGAVAPIVEQDREPIEAGKFGDGMLNGLGIRTGDEIGERRGTGAGKGV